MKQVHNLLRSTYCHWQGPAITWKCCFGSQLISAVTAGGKGWWGHEEGKGGGGILHVGRSLSHCCMKPFGCWPQCPELALPAAGRCSLHRSQLQRALQDDRGSGSALLTTSRSLFSCQDTQDSSWRVHQDHETAYDLPPVIQRSRGPGRDLAAALRESPVQCSLSNTQAMVDRLGEGKQGSRKSYEGN